ncbi:MAG: protein arginine kinase [Verrucomicrobiales bacterium]|nr:protein arginine kinase [Verrucomicrobiales bacterium]
MNLNDLIHSSGEWLRGSGPNANIVLSSRIRLARNLTTAPFTNRATLDELESVLATVESAVSRIPHFKDSTFFRLQEMTAVDRQFLIERHLMSPALAEHPEGRAVIVSKEEMLSVMVNEEDHLRIQLMQSGFSLDSAWKVIDAIDNELSGQLPYAWLPDFGFLTACPTNTGTAMRGSVMLHLPALVMTRQMESIKLALAKLNYTSRGYYGEGSEAIGNCYQISNQVSLGRSEEQIIQNINSLIHDVVEKEQQAREFLLETSRPMLEDRICRAWGILNSARVISSHETIELVSMVRLGVDAGIIEDLDYRSLNEVFILIQPAHLQKIMGKPLTSADRDIYRATLIREKFQREQGE